MMRLSFWGLKAVTCLLAGAMEVAVELAELGSSTYYLIRPRKDEIVILEVVLPAL